MQDPRSLQKQTVKRRFIASILLICLFTGFLGQIPITRAEELTDGEQPYNPDRYQPQYNTVASETKFSGSAGVDEFTGAATYNYQFEIPVGRNEVQPTVALSYNSQNMNNHNLVGFGWQFGEGAITRSNLKGTDQLYTLDEYQLSLPNHGQTLVSANGGIFQGKYEEDNWKYTFADNAWTVIDPSGIKYIFGAAVESRQDDPADASRVYKWMLQSIEDRNGNTIRYNYYKKYGNIYPKSIQYTGDSQNVGNREVRFYPFYDAGSNLAPNRNDKMISYASGFRTYNPYRLSKIAVYVDNVKLRESILNYTTGDNGERSLLSSIQNKTWDESGNTLNLPLTSFSYNDSGEKGWEEVSSLGTVGLPAMTQRPRYRDTGARILDVNGDALPDFVTSNLPSVSGLNDLRCADIAAGGIRLNTGRIADTSENYDVFQVLAGAFPVPIYYGGNNTSADVQIVDFNSDLYPDILTHCENALEVYERRLYRHDSQNGWLAPELANNLDLPSYWADGSYVDINGDGLTDFIHGGEREVFQNGLNFSVSSSVLLNHGPSVEMLVDLRPVTWQLPGGFTFQDQYARKQDAGNRLVDINADGLVDFVRSTAGGTTHPAGIYFNIGHGWQYEASTPEFNTNGEIIRSVGFLSLREIAPGQDIYTDNGARLVDINGDGLVDVLSAKQFDTDAHTSLKLNTGGHGFINPSANYQNAYALPVGFVTEAGFDMGTRLVDINGDGLDDIIQEYDTDANFGSTAANKKVYLNKTNLGVDRMKSITNEYHGEVSFEYTPSTAYKSGSLPVLDNPKLPISVLTVSKVTYDDKLGSPYSDSYYYKDGHYYFDHSYHRELAGFGIVRHTDSKGNFERSYFHQSEKSVDYSNLGEYQDHFSKKGRLFRKEFYSANQKLAQTIYRYTHTDLGGSRYRVLLAQMLQQTFGSGGSHKDTAESYLYDNYGNLTKKTEYGEVSGNNDGSFTDLNSDQVITETSYALNSTDNLLGFPKEVIVKDEVGNVLQKSQLEYDNLALGQVSRGNVTKQARISPDGSTRLETTVSYDIHGNKTATTDPKGNTTQFAYDAHGILPTTITNPLDQSVSLSYDLFGHVTASTDVNNVTRTYVYDPAGRIKEVLMPDPNDGLQQKTMVKRSYFFNETPVKIVQETRNEDHPNEFLPAHHYFDGFGRMIQTRQENAENQYIVSDQIFGENGKVRWKALSYFDNTSAYAQDITKPGVDYWYDPLDRLTKKTTPEGDTVTAYNLWTQTVTNPEGQISSAESDAFGRTILSRQKLGADNIDTVYAYDRSGNLLTITDDQGNKRSFTYDNFERLIESSEWYRAGAESIPVWHYAYDQNGNILSSQDPEGQWQVKSYDALNRPTQLVSKDCAECAADLTTNLSYDQGSYGKGQLTAVSKGSYAAEYHHDALGRIAEQVITIDGEVYTTTQTFDLSGRMTELEYPDHSKALYHYNRGGYLDQVDFESASGLVKTIASNIEYSPYAQITSLDYGNGIQSVNEYDPLRLYRMEHKETVVPGTSGGVVKIQDLDYSYDAVGNITALDDSVNDEVSAFSYDALNRLIAAEAHNSADVSLYSRNYQYDSIGNITHKSDLGNLLYTHANPQIVTSAGDTTLSYDLNGNRTSDGNKQLIWNTENALQSVTEGEDEYRYWYDHQGQRYKKENVATSEITHYLGEHFEKTIEGEEETARRYIFAGNQRLATVSDEDLSTPPVAEMEDDHNPVLAAVPTAEDPPSAPDAQLIASSSELQSANLVAYGNAPINPIYHYKFNEGVGTTTVNSRYPSFPGTIIGATWTTGKNSNALNFTLVPSDPNRVTFVQTEEWIPGYNTHNTLSFGGWVKRVTPSFTFNNNRTVAYKPDMFKLVITNAGKAECTMYPNGKEFLTNYVVTSSQVVSGDWQHVYCTYDGSKFKVFVNGVKGGEVSASFALTDTRKDLVVGARKQSTIYTDGFSGPIDEVRVYKEALSEAAVMELYHEFDPNWPLPPAPPTPPAPPPPPPAPTCPASLPGHLSGQLPWVGSLSDWIGNNDGFKLIDDFEGANPTYSWLNGPEGAMTSKTVSLSNQTQSKRLYLQSDTTARSVFKILPTTIAVNDYPYLRFNVRWDQNGNETFKVGIETTDGQKTLYGISTKNNVTVENPMSLANGLWETRVINLRDATVSPAANKQIQKIWIILDNDAVQLDNIALQREGAVEANFNNVNDLQNWQPGAWGAVNVKSVTFDSTLNSNRLVATVPAGEYGSLRLDVPNLPADLFPYLRLKIKRENATAQGRILIGVKTMDGVNTYFSWTNMGGTNYNVINIPTEWTELKLNHRDATVNPTAGKMIDKIEIFYQGNQTLGVDDIKLWVHDKDPVIPDCNNPTPPPSSGSGSSTTQNAADPEIAYLNQTLIAPYVYYHHPDHLGSSSLTTDENRHTINSIRYYPYGGTRVEEGTSANAYKFTDQEEDAETDLYYYGARYYDPMIGRFISNDPLQQNIGQMIQLGEFNGYRYVLNNPVKYMDPTGEYTWSEWMLVSSNPIKAATAYSASTYAHDKSLELYPGMQQHNGAGDAFRHALWNAIMAKELGSYWAKQFADAHEDFEENPTGEKQMDLYNNQQGRLIGQDYLDDEYNWEDIVEGVKQSLNNGDLQTDVDEDNGVVRENEQYYDPGYYSDKYMTPYEGSQNTQSAYSKTSEQDYPDQKKE